jgi:hypothetical protein
MLAANGNLLVAERVRRVLEAATPNSCRYLSTHYQGTCEQTPWTLAVPMALAHTGTVRESIARCNACGEPESGHPGTQYSERYSGYFFDLDVGKSRNWMSSERGWDKWLKRETILSVRLLSLLERIGAKGLVEATGGRNKTADLTADLQWVEEQVAVLSQIGVPIAPAGQPSKGDLEWFQKLLTSRPKIASTNGGVVSIEKIRRIKLGKFYHEFMTRIGPIAYCDVDGVKGNNIRLLSADEIDSKTFRRGRIKALDAKSNAVDGVKFADTDAGDCYCFDLNKGRLEPEVFLYRHEGNYFEPFAENFIQFLRRCAGS